MQQQQQQQQQQQKQKQQQLFCKEGKKKKLPLSSRFFQDVRVNPKRRNLSQKEKIIIILFYSVLPQYKS